MGIGVAFIFFCILGTLAALVAGGVLFVFARRVAKNAPSKAFAKSRLGRFAFILPFASLGWAVVVFVLYAFINEGLLHRSPGLGDSANCPLPNGYAIAIVDATAILFNPRTQGGNSLGGNSLTDGPDAAMPLVRLQVAGNNMFGSTAFNQSSYEQGNPAIEKFFALNARSGSKTVYETEEQLHAVAASVGVVLKLEPYGAIYDRYEYTWFDAFALVLLFGPPAAGLICFVRAAFAVRAQVITAAPAAR